MLRAILKLDGCGAPRTWIPAFAGMTPWVGMVWWALASRDHSCFLGLDPRTTRRLCRAERGPRVEPEGDAVGGAGFGRHPAKGRMDWGSRHPTLALPIKGRVRSSFGRI